MSRLSQKELDEYIELYDTIVQESLERYDENGREGNLTHMIQFRNHIEDEVDVAKLAEAAAYKDRDYDIEEYELKEKLQGQFPLNAAEPLNYHLPLSYAVGGGETIILHLAEKDIRAKLE